MLKSLDHLGHRGYTKAMPTNTEFAAMTDAQVTEFARNFIRHMCPRRQDNRDYAVDVIMATTKRQSMRGHTINGEIFAWMDEAPVTP